MRVKSEQSAAIILRHVTEGVELGRKHRLPQRILDLSWSITDRHGALPVFQRRPGCRGDESLVDKAKFTYQVQGPERETAIFDVSRWQRGARARRAA